MAAGSEATREAGLARVSVARATGRPMRTDQGGGDWRESSAVVSDTEE